MIREGNCNHEVSETSNHLTVWADLTNRFLFSEGLDELKVTRKKKVGKRLKQAPAVDSTLLRFMWGAQQNQSSCDEYPGSDPSMSDKDDSGSSDFENCSSVLQSLGVEKWLSREAGRSVDRHLLGTAARSRVRGFLRQRDMIWLSDDAVSQGKGEPEGYINGDARSNQSSGFKEILDVLSEHTLSPTDAALVLIHTPDIRNAGVLSSMANVHTPSLFSPGP